MAIIGFNLTKMSCERKQQANGKITVSNNINITQVDEAKLNAASSTSTALAISFRFELKYNPDVGSILIEGNILELTTEVEAKENVAAWKERKVIKPALFQTIMNAIFSRCQVHGIILAKELALPSPVPLPKIKVEQTAAGTVKSVSVASTSATPAPKGTAAATSTAAKPKK